MQGCLKPFNKNALELWNGCGSRNYKRRASWTLIPWHLRLSPLNLLLVNLLSGLLVNDLFTLVHSSRNGLSASIRCLCSIIILLSGSEGVVTAHFATPLHWLLWLEPFNRLLYLRILVYPTFFILLVRRGITSEVPRVVHHEGEVVIVINGD